MTSPPRPITVECPKCARRYQSDHRASMNLDLDNFDEDYLRRASTATCPDWGHVVELDTLVIEQNVWRFACACRESSRSRRTTPRF